jgi:hypothetical protein
LKAPCESLSILRDLKPLNFTEEARFESAFNELVERLCPPGGPGVAEAESLIDQAWNSALYVDPGGLDAKPSPERDALLAALLHFKIEEPATEGLALKGFSHAAALLLRNHKYDDPAAYNMKMLLGECVAVAVLHHSRYRQITQRYLDLEIEDREDPVLTFVVVRAYSKLAEIDPALVDLGVLLRVATQLDARAALNKKKEVIAMLLGRVAAKLRGTDLGDLLIQTLSRAGAAARMATIVGVCMGEKLSPSVFYFNELTAMRAARGAGSGALKPPSRKLQALLSGIDLDQPSVVQQLLKIGRDDLRRAFAIDDIPYGYHWSAVRSAPPALHQHHAPFMGTVVKATTANMEELALRLNASHVVCLTEPRIVDALFDRAGSLLIPLQDENSPQCRRLNSRSVPFAMLAPERMAELKDGDHIVIEANRTRAVVLEKWRWRSFGG